MSFIETEVRKKRSHDKLDNLKIKNFKIDKEKDYKKTDGKGLYLFIKKTGSKLWQFQYRDPLLKKQKVLSFGAYPEVSLAEARLRCDEARKKIRQNIDPSTEKKAIKAARHEVASNTFGVIAREWVIKRDKQNDGRLKRILEIHLLPHLGLKPP